jgi:hypothetical protein
LGQHDPCHVHKGEQACPPPRGPCTLGTLANVHGHAATGKGMASRRGGRKESLLALEAVQSICCTQSSPQLHRCCCHRWLIHRRWLTFCNLLGMNQAAIAKEYTITNTARN